MIDIKEMISITANKELRHNNMAVESLCLVDIDAVLVANPSLVAEGTFNSRFSNVL